MSDETLRAELYRLVARSPTRIRCVSSARARTIRRAIYLEKARLLRLDPDTMRPEEVTFFLHAFALTFHVSGPLLIIKHKAPSSLTQELARVRQLHDRFTKGTSHALTQPAVPDSHRLDNPQDVPLVRDEGVV